MSVYLTRHHWATPRGLRFDAVQLPGELSCWAACRAAVVWLGQLNEGRRSEAAGHSAKCPAIVNYRRPYVQPPLLPRLNSQLPLLPVFTVGWTITGERPLLPSECRAAKACCSDAVQSPTEKFYVCPYPAHHHPHLNPIVNHACVCFPQQLQCHSQVHAHHSFFSFLFPKSVFQNLCGIQGGQQFSRMQYKQQGSTFISEKKH